MTDHLLRGLAPIPSTAWKLIDDEARERLTPLLAARQIVDFAGPHGWRHDALSTGRAERLGEAPAGTSATAPVLRQRQVLPLTEFRIPFVVNRAEIDDMQRGAASPDLDDLDRAAREAAAIETRAVFHGWDAAGIAGIADATGYPTAELGTDCSTYPTTVALAVDRMRRNGIEGPYDLVIGSQGYTRIVETTEEGGYLLLDHLGRILGGKVIWAPAVDGAFVLARGDGNFLLDVGQDLAIGYSHHDADTVHLYLEESFTFRVREPDAACVLL